MCIKVDWSIDGRKTLSKTLPKIISLYLDKGLIYEESSSKDRFNFFNGDEFELISELVDERITDYSFDRFSEEIVRSGARSGLIISWSKSQFRIKIVRATDGHWIPVASWGRKQIEAIAELNKNELDEIITFKSYTPSQGSANLGSGTAVWGDIVELVNLGVDIANRLPLNPSDVREIIIIM